jgi:cytidylate kinase
LPLPERLVTVDGPAGSGKTTLGRRLALALRLPLIDTGLFYRGITVAALRRGVAIDDVDALIRVARQAKLEISTDPAAPPGAVEVRVDGHDAGSDLRDPRHAALLTRVSSIAEVRAAVLAPQRALAAGGAVAVGRDCGTVVFPEAPVKIYLQAPEEVRVRRRVSQLSGTGDAPPGATMTAEVRGRDRADSQRSAGPLRRAADAHVLDTGQLSIDETFQRALSLCGAAGL